MTALREWSASASHDSAAGINRRQLLLLSASRPRRRERWRWGAPPKSELTWGCTSCGAFLVGPGRSDRHHHALHDPVRAARRNGEIDAWQEPGAQLGRVVACVSEDGLHLRFCAPRRCESSIMAIRSLSRMSSSPSIAIAALR